VPPKNRKKASAPITGRMQRRRKQLYDGFPRVGERGGRTHSTRYSKRGERERECVEVCVRAWWCTL
jgi:hypothetical protein